MLGLLAYFADLLCGGVSWWLVASGWCFRRPQPAHMTVQRERTRAAPFAHVHKMPLELARSNGHVSLTIRNLVFFRLIWDQFRTSKFSPENCNHLSPIPCHLSPVTCPRSHSSLRSAGNNNTPRTKLTNQPPTNKPEPSYSQNSSVCSTLHISGDQTIQVVRVQQQPQHGRRVCAHQRQPGMETPCA
jgi:hypothetical protein